MSWRDPDHLPMPLNPCGNHPDMELLEDWECDACGGTGTDQDVLEARGIEIDCEACKGSGAKQ